MSYQDLFSLKNPLQQTLTPYIFIIPLFAYFCKPEFNKDQCFLVIFLTVLQKRGGNQFNLINKYHISPQTYSHPILSPDMIKE